MLLNQQTKADLSYLLEDDTVQVIKIPLTGLNLLCLALILLLTFVGTYYVWLSLSRKRCICQLCQHKFEIGSKIAKGGFGELFLLHNYSRIHTEESRASTLASENQSEPVYVMKKLLVGDLSELDFIQQEAKQLRRLQHKNIVAYEDDFLHLEDHTWSQPRYHFVIIMEFCHGGNLLDHLRGDPLFDAEGASLGELKLMGYFLGICEAVKYIHAKDIIHRDIKSPNIFLTLDGSTAKLGDFGLSISSNLQKSRVSAVGTDCYMSPELHRGKGYHKGKAADIWALGCVLFEMLTGRPVWEHELNLAIQAIEDPESLKVFLDEQVSQKFDPEIKSLLKKMLHPDPDHRITIDQIFKRKFIKKY